MAHGNGPGLDHREHDCGAREAVFGKRRPSSRSKISPQVSREAWAARIASAWCKAVAAFVETGRRLLEAKRSLPHGSFLEMIAHDLPFSLSTAERLMSIARHSVLANPAHGRNLPASWRTLAELARLPAPKLRSLIKDRTVHPGMQRQDAERIVDGLLFKDMAARTRVIRGEVRTVVLDVSPASVRPFFGAQPLDAAQPESAANAPVSPALREHAAPNVVLLAPPVDSLLKYRNLVAAWDAASPDERRRFLDYIGARIEEREGES